MSSMSYCKFENTLNDIGQCIAAMAEAYTTADLEMSKYEVSAFGELFHACREFLAEHERLLINSTEI